MWQQPGPPWPTTAPWSAPSAREAWIESQERGRGDEARREQRRRKKSETKREVRNEERKKENAKKKIKIKK